MSRSIISRGFPKAPDNVSDLRVPPGQIRTEDFPILTIGATPNVPLEHWSLTVEVGGVSQAVWTWAEVAALPKTRIKTDIHCVTKWSKLDTISSMSGASELALRKPR